MALYLALIMLLKENIINQTKEQLEMSKKKMIEELSREMEEPTFWDDADKANKKTRNLKNMQDLVAEVEGLHKQYDDMMDLIDLQNEEGVDDDDMAGVPEILFGKQER